jgi:hypothetical protein
MDGSMTEFLRAPADRDPAAIDRLLADRVRFQSPVRTYRDRADILHLLSTLAGLFEGARPSASGKARAAQ